MTQPTMMNTLESVAKRSATELSARKAVLEEGLTISRNSASIICAAQSDIKVAMAALGIVKGAIGDGEGRLRSSACAITTIMEDLYGQIGPLSESVKRIDKYYEPTGAVVEAMRQHSLGAIRLALQPSMVILDGTLLDFGTGTKRTGPGATNAPAYCAPGQRLIPEPMLDGVPMDIQEQDGSLESLMAETAASFRRCAELFETAVEHMSSAHENLGYAVTKLEQASGKYGAAHDSIQGKQLTDGVPELVSAKNQLAGLIHDIGNDTAAINTTAAYIGKIIASSKTALSSVLGGMAELLASGVIAATEQTLDQKQEQGTEQDSGQQSELDSTTVVAVAVAKALDGDISGFAVHITADNADVLAQALFGAVLVETSELRATNVVGVLKTMALTDTSNAVVPLLHRLSTEHSIEGVKSAATAAMVDLSG